MCKSITIVEILWDYEISQIYKLLCWQTFWTYIFDILNFAGVYSNGNIYLEIKFVIQWLLISLCFVSYYFLNSLTYLLNSFRSINSQVVAAAMYSTLDNVTQFCFRENGDTYIVVIVNSAATKAYQFFLPFSGRKKNSCFLY